MARLPTWLKVALRIANNGNRVARRSQLAGLPMTPGPALDRAVAEAMGLELLPWVACDDAPAGQYAFLPNGDTIMPWRPSQPEGRAQAMTVVLDWLVEHARFGVDIDLDPGGGPESVEVRLNTCDAIVGDTLEHCLCLAVLAVRAAC